MLVRMRWQSLFGIAIGWLLRWSFGLRGWWRRSVSLDQPDKHGLYFTRHPVVAGDLALQLASRQRGVHQRSVESLDRKLGTTGPRRIDPGSHPHHSWAGGSPAGRASIAGVEPRALQVTIPKLDPAYGDRVGP